MDIASVHYARAGLPDPAALLLILKADIIKSSKYSICWIFLYDAEKLNKVIILRFPNIELFKSIVLVKSKQFFACFLLLQKQPSLLLDTEAVELALLLIPKAHHLQFFWIFLY